MAFRIPFEPEELDVLAFLVNWWYEGMEEATNDVKEDKNLETAEDLVTAVEGMHEQFDIVTKIKMKVDAAKECYGRAAGEF